MSMQSSRSNSRHPALASSSSSWSPKNSATSSSATSSSPWPLSFGGRSRRSIMPAVTAAAAEHAQHKTMATSSSSGVSTKDATKSLAGSMVLPPLQLEAATTTTATESASTIPEPTIPVSVVSWLETSCPADVLPKILALAGPQSTRSLYETNRHWKHLVEQEATWKILCVDSYKWKEGDAEPASWKELYRMSPCVPVDYSTIAEALQVAQEAAAAASVPPSHQSPSRLFGRLTENASNSKHYQQSKSIRILLRPTLKYSLEEAIVVCAPPGVTVSMETIQLPPKIYARQLQQQHQHQLLVQAEQAASNAVMASPNSSSGRKKKRLLRWNCKAGTRDQVVVMQQQQQQDLQAANNSIDSQHSESSMDNEADDAGLLLSQSSTMSDELMMDSTLVQTATVSLKTRRHNEPFIFCQQGMLELRGIFISHSSHGMDIWSGNAAVQIQPVQPRIQGLPPLVPLPPPMTLNRPVCRMTHCQVTSRSGRGIVCMDGGMLQMESCAVTKCAATGVYIGGPGTSRASMEHSDVVLNGLGSRSRGGIARGHSGIYLEQGVAKIADCSVSNNTLTGISAVSPENAVIQLTNSELFNNGSYQLELPPAGSAARRQSDVSVNVMAAHGQVNLRSGLLVDAKVHRRLNRGRMILHRATEADNGVDANGLPFPLALGDVQQQQQLQL